MLIDATEAMLSADRSAPIGSLYDRLSEEALREALRSGDLFTCRQPPSRLVVEPGHGRAAVGRSSAGRLCPAFRTPHPEEALGALRAAFDRAADIAAASLPHNPFAEIQNGELRLYRLKASCLSLLSNAAVRWNTVHMARITRELRETGNQIAEEDLAHVWPLQHTRIIPNGTYFLNRSRDKPTMVPAL